LIDQKYRLQLINVNKDNITLSANLYFHYQRKQKVQEEKVGKKREERKEETKPKQALKIEAQRK